MRLLTISILILFSVVSCSLPTTKGLLEETLQQKTHIENPYFSLSKDYVYKTKIKAFGNKFGGFLVFKKIKGLNYRIVFTSSFGNKIFDFEKEKDKIITRFILEEINKKAVIKLLKNDFLTLLKNKIEILQTYKSKEDLVYKTKFNKKYNYYFIDNTTKKLKKIVTTSRYQEKTLFTFKKEDKEIQIQHKKYPIEISLKLLDF
ncbi:hypothetical protein [Tenacibaculum halocynthiae]|uniref:hypothetical protein n=1 Tax=Tenacibaculum halocynthiae TaxID=1254437 RepID=UPI003893CD9A